MLKRQKEQGFTLIELLLVVVIIGILLAVIVPRAWRANIDAKYGLVRQNASELASFASLWAEKAIGAQDETGYDNNAPTLADYYASLATSTSPASAPQGDNEAADGIWIAYGQPNNWRSTGDLGFVEIAGRRIGDASKLDPEDKVEDLVPVDRMPLNPFNSIQVFDPRNNPLGQGSVIPGAIAAGGVTYFDARGTDDDGDGVRWFYLALVFQGTDSTTTAVDVPTSFHGGGGTQDLENLRNGIFVARYQVPGT